jgi:hypothetical protein
LGWLSGHPKSTFGFAVFLGDNLVSWSSKWQDSVSCSSAATVLQKPALRQLLHELHHPLSRNTLVYCDNVSDVYLSTNPVQHQRTKHVEIDVHFIREKVAIGYAHVLHIPTSQFADIFTKGLPTSFFEDSRYSLC